MALALIDENPNKGDTDDLYERAPYILASFCSLCKNLDKTGTSITITCNYD